MIRDTCAGCGSMELFRFLELGSSPLADNFISDPAAVEPMYDLSLLVCEMCYLVQLEEVVPDEELFNKDYTFYSSTSEPIRKYHKDYAAELLTQFEQGQRLTVEIASNDGSLLKHFHTNGWKSLGIDPAGGPSDAARELGLDIITAPFNAALATDVRDDYGHAGLIIANNVLAHVTDPLDFLAGVERLLAPDGVAVIEVQNLDSLLVGNMFDHVYHEHRFYYSTASLLDMLNRVGLDMVDIRYTEPQGGSIRVVAAKNVPHPVRVNQGAWLQQTSTYESFQGRVNYVRNHLLRLIYEGRFRKIAGYGATAKSTTLLNFCDLDESVIDYVVDTTPAKVGKFTPGTHIPIISPEQEQEQGYPDAYLLLAWNYLGPILRKSDLTQQSSTRWIVPIPMPVIL